MNPITIFQSFSPFSYVRWSLTRIWYICMILALILVWFSVPQYLSQKKWLEHLAWENIVMNSSEQLLSQNEWKIIYITWVLHGDQELLDPVLDVAFTGVVMKRVVETYTKDSSSSHHSNTFRWKANEDFKGSNDIYTYDSTWRQSSILFLASHPMVGTIMIHSWFLVSLKNGTSPLIYNPKNNQRSVYIQIKGNENHPKEWDVRAKFYITSWWKMVYLLWKQINNTIVPYTDLHDFKFDYISEYAFSPWDILKEKMQENRNDLFIKLIFALILSFLGICFMRCGVNIWKISKDLEKQIF